MRRFTIVLAAIALAAAMPALAQERTTPTEPTRPLQRTVIIERRIERDGTREQKFEDSVVIEGSVDGEDLSELNVDSLRDEARRQVTKSKQLKIEMRRLGKELQKQMKDIKRSQFSMKIDSAQLSRELKQELEAVQKSIDDANGNLLQLDSNLRNIVMPKGCRVSISTDSAAGNVMKRMVIVMGDSGKCGAFARSGKGMACARAQVFVRSFSDSAHGSSTFVINGFAGDSAFAAGFPPSSFATMGIDTTIVFDIEGAQPTVINKELVQIGEHSIDIPKGSKASVTIRRDTANGSTRAQISVVVKSKHNPTSTSVDTIQSSTLDTKADRDGASSTSSSGYQLDANRPNPFSAETVISFTLPKPGHTTLTVFNAEGKEVRVLKDEDLPAGTHSVTFDGSDLPSGTYLYRLISGGFSGTKTMTLSK